MSPYTINLLCTRLSPAAARELREALERYRVVGVLDAYEDQANPLQPHRPAVVVRVFGGYVTGLVKDVFPTRDAARAAAAKAIEAGEL